MVTGPTATAAPNEALFDAVVSNQAVQCRMLLRETSEASLNAASPNHGGMTCLALAANAGRTEIVRLLVQHAADVNVTAPECRDFTPLMFAAHHLHLEAAQALIRADASLEAKSARGETALSIVLCGRQCCSSCKSLRSAVARCILDAMRERREKKRRAARWRRENGWEKGDEKPHVHQRHKRRRLRVLSLAVEMR